jgi:RND family efflux transporter MFP subunit
MVKKGEMAMPGSPMLYIVNMQDFNIQGNVSENYLNDIREGEIVDVRFPTFPSEEYQLPITRVGSVIDNMSRTFQVEIEFTNTGNKIKPNQLSVMKINDFTDREALVVPSIIIKQDVTGNYLYVVKDNGEGPTATKVYVTTGRTYQENTMVEEGLSAGDRVIVEGYNLVKDGTGINIISE